MARIKGIDLPNDKQVYIFRPCMIHGPGNKGNLNLLYSVVRKGIPWPLGAFENRRTFTSIENICFAVNGVLTSDVESGIYNMGDDEALSTNELIKEICKSLGKKARIWRLPKGLMTGIAKVGGFLHLPLNPMRLQKLTGLEVEKLKAEHPAQANGHVGVAGEVKVNLQCICYCRNPVYHIRVCQGQVVFSARISTLPLTLL